MNIKPMRPQSPVGPFYQPDINFAAPPDEELPRDYIAVSETIVPSARAVNELLDYWREQAKKG